MSKNTSEIEKAWQGFERPGDGTVFRHYKGGLYDIVATGLIEESLTPCVVYRSQENGLVWVRTAENFFEQVQFESKITPRFSAVY